ncbi:hypothetical protein K8374_13170 [Pseudomonas sp. p1(2021b)]|uniref:hypothetical protein n=1 Tax=Pseudomonas sp. p1(2021b) TaxID=2874628 RepID=UPI001CCDFD9E|nr:hypothetical protein [Pseudomonas sp. p1(2021b)]UBM23354.1 hypothetical protein K8374_13170 [Pseudomonas sp. p1(2021b)]
MPEKIELDLDAIEAAAKAATPQDFVSAQVGGAEEGWMECPECGGEGSVELTADYLNYDGVALGVQFYGIGEPHVHAEAYYRAARPAVVLAMVEEIRNLRQQLEQQKDTSRTITLSGCEFTEDDLLRKAVRMANGTSRRKTPRWVLMKDVFCCGSGVAHALCRRFNSDPDEELSR